MVKWVKGTNPEVPQEPLHRLHAVLPAVATELTSEEVLEKVLEKLDGKKVTRKAIILDATRTRSIFPKKLGLMRRIATHYNAVRDPAPSLWQHPF